MRLAGADLMLSPTDLSNFLSCRHRTALELSEVAGERKRPRWDDPLLEILWQRGLEHERAYVESLRGDGVVIADLSALKDAGPALAATLRAMQDRADVIVQGALADEQWNGRPDVLRRVETPSGLGAWSYEAVDTKLARETRAGTILQLGLYSEMLRTAQGLLPECFYVVTPSQDESVQRYRTEDYAAYLRWIRTQLRQTVMQEADAVAAAHYPEPVDHCDICAWV